MTDLTGAEIGALHEALDDEYRSWATYDQVIADFGAVRPFSNIREAEGRHIDALQTLFVHYGVQVPVNPWPGNVTRYANLQAACLASVAAEIANGQMYDRLFQTTLRSDIRRVFENLREASVQRHLPAFRRCARRSAGAGCGGRRYRGGRP